VQYLRAVQFFLGTLVIYLVPPLLGWGADDLSGFFSLAPRGRALLIVILGLVAVSASSARGLRGGSDRGKLVRRQRIVKVVVILRCICARVLFFADRRNIGVMVENQRYSGPVSPRCWGSR
jgi:hypothetical protein